MSRRLIALLCLFAVLATACSYGARRATPSPFVPGTPRPSESATWRQLGEAYLVAADRAGRDYDRFLKRESAHWDTYGDTVKGYHIWCEKFMAVDLEFQESVEKIPWTAEYQEQVDAVLASTADVMALLEKCIKSKSLKTIHATSEKIDLAYVERQKASERLRKDLHLSTRTVH